MRIKHVAVFFAVIVLSPHGPLEAAANARLEAWFQSGRCTAFNGISSSKVPYARSGEERLEWVHRVPPFQPSGNASYAYDAKHGIVFRALGQDSTGSFIVRKIGPPPAMVPRADLSKIATTSGIRVGTSAANVVQKLGKPYIVDGCGQHRYAYLINKEVGGNALEFTIRDGRVVEIFQTYGD